MVACSVPFGEGPALFRKWWLYLQMSEVLTVHATAGLWWEFRLGCRLSLRGRPASVAQGSGTPGPLWCVGGRQRTPGGSGLRGLWVRIAFFSILFRVCSLPWDASCLLITERLETTDDLFRGNVMFSQDTPGEEGSRHRAGGTGLAQEVTPALPLRGSAWVALGEGGWSFLHYHAKSGDGPSFLPSSAHWLV